MRCLFLIARTFPGLERPNAVHGAIVPEARPAWAHHEPA
jgi:hypothetical protein